MSVMTPNIGESIPKQPAGLTAADHAAIRPSEIAVGVIIGRASEYFDFFVYAIASVLVFPVVFFPFLPKLEAALASFLVFSFAFIARPLGTVIFMEIQRRYGRGVKLGAALFLLGVSTAGIAFLPGHATLGIAAIALLSAFRFAQGIAVGGSWDGLPSLLALNAPERRRGWYAMVPQIGAPIGFIVAAGLFLYLHSSLSESDFLTWGWRYPFYVAFAINVVALFSRLRIVLTEEYEHQMEVRGLHPADVGELVKAGGGNLLIGAFAALASYALFHLITVFPLSWITLLGVFALCAPLLLKGGVLAQDVFILTGFVLLGLSYGQAAGAVTSNFEPRFRYTGAALTSDLAWLIGAAFAPLVALGLSARFGLAAVSVYLLSGVVATLVALYINHRLDDER
jgi:MFS family permease